MANSKEHHLKKMKEHHKKELHHKEKKMHHKEMAKKSMNKKSKKGY